MGAVEGGAMGSSFGFSSPSGCSGTDSGGLLSTSDTSSTVCNASTPSCFTDACEPRLEPADDAFPVKYYYFIGIDVFNWNFFKLLIDGGFTSLPWAVDKILINWMNDKLYCEMFKNLLLMIL